MLFAAHQPHYLPWLRYLHKVATADVFVLLDDVQYEKNGWQNRTRVKGADGPILLTVPVRAPLGARICDVRPPDAGWVRRHLAALESCYGRALAPWREPLADALEASHGASVAELGEATLDLLLRAFGITTPVVRSSELGVAGRASERLAAIGQALGADAYLTGAYALDAYLDPGPFAEAGIRLAVQRWACPGYRQRFERVGFTADLSAVDLLVNEPARPLTILLQGEEGASDPALAANARA
ncbi:WbqC-like protein [Gaiella occulta]|uniref:WbqC-like protein n=1 Tax=Gaiella occulta TaxID=1002870 RepID=A0A7M2Z1S9_9ACTN|nr:WbqC family protein [Gaiella occulta]RDI76270.1 WbqC-like protein [Gaiella occulta]